MASTVGDHSPLPLGPFKGLYTRGTPDEVPLDHFEQLNNFVPVGNGWTTRPGVGISQDVVAPLENIKRKYNYPTQTANTLLILTYDGTTGKIYHQVNSSLIYGPILTIVGMEDFAFVPYAGRAYITPFKSFITGDLNIQKGIESEFLYVYKGDGTAARKAAGPTPAGTLTIANGAAGHTDAGLHIFGVVGETDTGYLSPPIGLNSFTTSPALSLNFSTVPTFVGSQWIKRHIVGSIKIPSFSGDLNGYQLFFIPLAVINDNVTTTLNGISFYDADLFDDASHLSENFSEIPAGCSLSFYHERLVLTTTFNDISILLVSEEGEPEAINQIDGIMIVPPDGNPITCTQELRDILYVGKRSRTVSFSDNGDKPSTWPMTVIDNGLGFPVHGIATVLDSGANTVDFLFTTTYAGIMLFTGKYVMPELTWKIEKLWSYQNRNEFRRIQIINDPIRKWILCVLPDSRLLVGDYSHGINYKDIEWAPLSFDVVLNSVAIVNIDEIILGMDIPF